jgi:hypothetical protein
MSIILICFLSGDPLANVFTSVEIPEIGMLPIKAEQLKTSEKYHILHHWQMLGIVVFRRWLKTWHVMASIDI